jgi:signal transduction histidine kinase/ActR/RegA family two-component response regulator
VQNPTDLTIRFRQSLRARYLLAFVLIGFVPLVLAGGTGYLAARNIIVEQVQDRLLAASIIKFDAINDWIFTKRDNLTEIANLDVVIGDNAPDNGIGLPVLNAFYETPNNPQYRNAVISARTELNRYIGAEGDVVDILLLNQEGRIVLSVTNSHELGSDQTSELWYQARSQLTQFVEDQDLGTPGIFLSLPIVERSMVGAQIGTVVMILDTNTLSSFMTDRVEFQDSNTYEAYLVNQDNRMISESRFVEDAVLTQPVDTQAVSFARTLDDGDIQFVGGYSNYQTTEVFGAVAYDRAQDWVLVTEIAQEDVLRPTFALVNNLIVIAVVGLLAVVIAALAFAGRQAKPIAALTRGAVAMSRGDLKQRVETNDRSEIGALGTAFNTMAEELKTSYDTLEQRVDERTAQLAEARKQAEFANQAKSLFLSNMSHELRTPLNVIIGYTSSMLTMPLMYQNEQLPEVYRKDIDLIMANGQYLLGLINDILDLSKIEAGKLELQRSAVDVVDICKGVISTSIGLVRNKPIQIRPDFPDTLPRIHADPQRIRQIILNLMSNAIKFTETGSVTLQARVEGEKVRIAIIDTGIGIPEKALNHIFDRYRQAEQGTEKKYGGTGLGLDISKQLAQMHGGDLQVESEVNKGSTFYFTVPLASAEMVAQTTFSSKPTFAVSETAKTLQIYTPEEMGAESAYATTRTVLLVADDSTLSRVIRSAMETQGHLVMSVEDSVNAFEMAYSLLPDLIIMDASLPDQSAWSALQHLADQPETMGIPIILCGSPADAVRAQGISQGFLTKPLTTEALHRAASKALGSSEPKSS